MNNVKFTLLFLGCIGLTATAYAQPDTAEKLLLAPELSPTPSASASNPNNATDSIDQVSSANEEPSAGREPSASKESSAGKESPVSEEHTVDELSAKEEKQRTTAQEKPANTPKFDHQQSADLIKNAAKRGTPPWTNDSANINLQLSRTAADEDQAKPYSAEDFTVKPEWARLFTDNEHFSTNSGEELYQNLCQACHMADGQGAQGAGYFPSFVGNERLRSPDYPIAVILNGFRGMPPFADMLNNQQIADVVNHLRTHFGNQLSADTQADDVARARPEK